MDLNTVLLGVYVLLVGAGLWLLLTRRLSVLFALAFLSAVAYSFPLFMGFAMYPGRGGTFTPTSLIPIAYVVNSAILAAILLAGSCAREQMSAKRRRWRLQGTHLAGWSAMILSLALLAYGVVSAGSDLFSEDKLVVLKATGRGYSLAMVAAFVAVAFAIEMRSRIVLVLALTVLAFDLYIGFRAWTVMAIAVAAVLYLSSGEARREGPRRVNRTLVATLAVLALGVFFYKGIFPNIKAGEFDVAWAKLQDPEFYLASVIIGEPFIVQGVLNEVLLTDYSVSGEHLLNVFLLLLIYTPELGFNVRYFNDYFQEDLFPGTSEFMGMGNNFWAEALSVGGVGGLVMYLGLFIAGLYFATKLLASESRVVRATAASVAVPWAFYIHRNELIVHLSYERQIILVVVSAILGSMLLSEIANALKRSIVPVDSKEPPRAGA